jgi:hypothetical protein
LIPVFAILFLYLRSVSFLNPPDGKGKRYDPEDIFEHDSWKKYGKWKQLLKPFYETAAFMIEGSGCMFGCRENAKNSLDKNYLYFAENMP